MKQLVFTILCVVAAVWIAIQQKDAVIAAKDAALIDKDAVIAAKDALLGDANHARKTALKAVDDSTVWLRAEITKVYADVTDDELDSAVRWVGYAQPESPLRSCSSPELDTAAWLDNDAAAALLADLIAAVSSTTGWSATTKKKYLALHAFHSTGIEGNTLSLPETKLVVDDEPLFAGFHEDKVSTPLLTASVMEVRNFYQIFDGLGLSSPSGASGASWVEMSLQRLVDINAAIIRGVSHALPGLRNHSVSIGHQRVLLPQSDEVPHLLGRYVAWLNAAVKAIVAAQELDPHKLVAQAVGLACDAHTRFVHIHPFSDGNGRLARILSGLVLKTFRLPAPMFTKERREEYIHAVGSATVNGSYASLCKLHAEAVKRSLQVVLVLQREEDEQKPEQ